MILGMRLWLCDWGCAMCVMVLRLCDCCYVVGIMLVEVMLLAMCYLELWYYVALVLWGCVIDVMLL